MDRSLIIFRTFSYSNHNIFWSYGLLDLFDCSLRVFEKFWGISFYLQSSNPKYSLIFSNYSSLDMCSWFHSYFEKCTIIGGTLYIGLLNCSRPFWQWMPMGEKFRGFKGIWFYAFAWFLSICLLCSCILACLSYKVA